MCVILVCEEKRPSEEMVGRAWGHNDHGGGVAWIEGKGAKAEVHWKKGLELDEMQDFCKTLPLPFIAHFRIASSGSKHPTLCHPFPCTPDVSTSLAGKLKGAVMFHNGTWTQWKNWSLEASVRKGMEVPEGLWNDTRAMAWMAGIYGVNVLEFIGEKAAVLRTNGAECFGDGWTEEAGIWVSNRAFLHSGKGWGHHGVWPGTDSINVKVNDKQQVASPGGVLASEVPFRGSGETVLPGEDVEESVQEGTQDVQEGNGEGRTAKNQTLITEVLPTDHPIRVAAERLRQIRAEGNTDLMVILGPTAPSGSPLWKTPQEAAAEARREREKRLDAARKGITFIGEM